MGLMTDTASLSLVCEMDLMDDAIRSLSYAMGALGCRHGAEYRDYERRLGELLDAPLTNCTFEYLEATRLIIVPPVSWRAMVDEGVALGVI
jgi:hypothetical protein